MTRTKIGESPLSGVLLLAIASASWAAAAQDADVWPGSQWPAAAPEAVGMDSALLAQARDWALTGGGSGLIVRRGRVVMQWGDPQQTYDLKVEGGFGIYEAPEPWGPWRTVFFTEAWDMGPGESSSLPTKWISPDGRTCHLVFSGDDGFCVRKLTLRGR